VAVAVLHQMMVPYQVNGRLFVMHPHRPTSAWTDGDRVTGVVLRGLESGRDFLVEAPFFIDATPYGELLALAGVEHVLGAESQSETGEPHAAEQADPRDQQAITVCFALEYRPGENHTIDKPRRYEFWREYCPPAWTGRLLSWTTVRPETHEPLTRYLFEADSPRQILDPMGHFEFAVGMRLHFLIFAALRGTPFAALPYASKVMGLLEDLEMPMPPLGSIGIGQLIARIDSSWDTRAEMTTKLRERVPALRARAQQTNQLLLGVLKERRPDNVGLTEPAGVAGSP
jgi:hypothetical protein